MDWTVYVILGGAVLAGVAVLIKSRSVRGPSPRQLSVAAPEVGADVQARAQELLLQGQKIAAIKEVRSATGLGLKEAKDYVDALEAGQSTQRVPGPIQSASLSAIQPPQPRSLSAEERREVQALIDAGQKIEAIKRVREYSGLGLKEAKDLVEQGMPHSFGAAPAGDPLVGGQREQPRPLNVEERHEIEALVLRGRKIEAIKRIREITGLGLREAKDMVDGM